MGKRSREIAARRDEPTLTERYYGPQRSFGMAGVVVGALVLCIALIGLAVWATMRQPKEELIAEIGDTFEIQGQQHIEVGAAHDPYNSNPPTSGPHYVTPSAPGIYDTELADETLVHNLEHGYVWISYKPGSVDEETIKNIANLARPYTKVIVTARSANDTPIAVASWGKLLKLDSYDQLKIKSFIVANRFKAPEPDAP
ncbi:MAG TPA: DUF3105 domain-containing protein [Verrucomicrobiae bacterium]|nr:DUF3105 domain-containing protein [Verrucomicrobiae bacterium]